MQSAIEFHDSVISSSTIDGTGLRLNLAPAYVHVSAGNPGVDRGKGYSQTAEIYFGNVRLDSSHPSLPQRIAEGSLNVGGNDLQLLAVPIDIVSSVSIHFYLEDGTQFAFQAESIRAVLVGEPSYIEEFGV